MEAGEKLYNQQVTIGYLEGEVEELKGLLKEKDDYIEKLEQAFIKTIMLAKLLSDKENTDKIIKQLEAVIAEEKPF